MIQAERFPLLKMKGMIMPDQPRHALTEHSLTLFIFIVLMSIISSNGWTIDNTFIPSAINVPDVSGIQAHTIHSRIIQESYTLFIALPAGYSDSSKAYPVQYILDGSPEHVAMVSGISRFLCSRKIIPETIIVGISHGDVSKTKMKRRMRDFSPVPQDRAAVNKPGWGGAEPFARFMETELFPLVETRYRTVTGDRLICGHSMGGLFALHLFFHHPEMCNRYIVSSPSITGGMYENALSWAAKRTPVSARLYLAVGSLEDWRGSPEFSHSIARGTGSKSTVVFERNENTDHASVIPRAYSRGVASVFSPKQQNFLPSYPIYGQYNSWFKRTNYKRMIHGTALFILVSTFIVLFLYNKRHFHVNTQEEE